MLPRETRRNHREQEVGWSREKKLIRMWSQLKSRHSMSLWGALECEFCLSQQCGLTQSKGVGLKIPTSFSHQPRFPLTYGGWVLETRGEASSQLRLSSAKDHWRIDAQIQERRSRHANNSNYSGIKSPSFSGKQPQSDRVWKAKGWKYSFS